MKDLGTAALLVTGSIPVVLKQIFVVLLTSSCWTVCICEFKRMYKRVQDKGEIRIVGNHLKNRLNWKPARPKH